MATAAAEIEVEEPFPIFKIAHHYLLYDVDTITYIRRTYNICGVLIGGLPQAPQQNVFLGIPLELMPEEARLLVEKGAAYVVDDVKMHKQKYLGNGLSAEERKAYQEALRKQGAAAAWKADVKRTERRKEALKHRMETHSWNDVPEDMLRPATRGQKAASTDASDEVGGAKANGTVDEDDMLFASPTDALQWKQNADDAVRVSSSARLAQQSEPYAITPTTSYPPLQCSPPGESEVPEVPVSYPLFKHLHDLGYFTTPGLRFGCQYTAYPGDPLRYHSHFLCDGMEWEQEFDLLDLVGGGRLGTGVKKGFLIGGEQPKEETVTSGKGSKVVDDHDRSSDGSVRVFCIEWGGM